VIFEMSRWLANARLSLASPNGMTRPSWPRIRKEASWACQHLLLGIEKQDARTLSPREAAAVQDVSTLNGFDPDRTILVDDVKVVVAFMDDPEKGDRDRAREALVRLHDLVSYYANLILLRPLTE